MLSTGPGRPSPGSGRLSPGPERPSPGSGRPSLAQDSWEAILGLQGGNTGPLGGHLQTAGTAIPGLREAISVLQGAVDQFRAQGGHPRTQGGNLQTAGMLSPDRLEAISELLGCYLRNALRPSPGSVRRYPGPGRSAPQTAWRQSLNRWEAISGPPGGNLRTAGKPSPDRLEAISGLPGSHLQAQRGHLRAQVDHLGFRDAISRLLGGYPRTAVRTPQDRWEAISGLPRRHLRTAGRLSPGSGSPTPHSGEVNSGLREAISGSMGAGGGAQCPLQVWANIPLENVDPPKTQPRIAKVSKKVRFIQQMTLPRAQGDHLLAEGGHVRTAGRLPTGSERPPPGRGRPSPDRRDVLSGPPVSGRLSPDSCDVVSKPREAIPGPREAILFQAQKSHLRAQADYLGPREVTPRLPGGYLRTAERSSPDCRRATRTAEMLSSDRWEAIPGTGP